MNSSKHPSSKVSKAAKNTVGVQMVKGMIRLSLPREISRAAYGVAQKFINPGLKAEPLNIKLMEAKASQISIDIATGNFDPSWEKYELGVVASNHLKVIDGGKPKPDMPLLELYDLYCESRKNDVAETTLRIKLQGDYRKCIESTINTVNENALEIRTHLLNNYSTATTKEVLRHTEKAYQMGIKHGYINNPSNPFEGMAAAIKIIKKNKQNQLDSRDENEDSDIRAYSVDEMNAIIDAFESNNARKHFASFVKFLFWTGCRTGEASGLKWRDIVWDKQIIRFRRTYNHELKLFKPTKTRTIRIFPLPENGLLWNLLKSIDRDLPDSVVFKSKTGKIINPEQLGKIWRGDIPKRQPGVIPELIAQGKVKEYLKLYATRHTFISHQVNLYKIPITTVAAWVGNGAMVSNNHYLDRDRLTIPGCSTTLAEAPKPNKLSELVSSIKDLSPEQLEALKSLLGKDS